MFIMGGRDRRPSMNSLVHDHLLPTRLCITHGFVVLELGIDSLTIQLDVESAGRVNGAG